MPELDGLVRLRGCVQSYDWGKVGSSSAVAQLARAGGAISAIDEEKTYAELWFGTHPNGPSTIWVEGTASGGPLTDWLKENPKALSVHEEQDVQLCFLFKILSVNKALSIQAHPTKERAEELFAERPDLYKDANHKPEMALAITEFEALLGFERLETIVERVELTPELRNLVEVDGGDRGARVWAEMKKNVGSTNAEERKEALRGFFACFMASTPEHVIQRVGELLERVNLSDSASPTPKKERINELNALAVRLHSQFSNDVGIFCAYVMCYRKLEPGQAVFLAANEPHAYLSGDCVEVMANSDNVIRAALTPKFKDLRELESMLTCSEPGAAISKDDTIVDGSQGWHPMQILKGRARDANTIIYAPPDKAVTEFQLEKTVLVDDRSYVMAPVPYASIVFVLDGRGEAKWDQGMNRCALFRGATFFQPAMTEISISGNNLTLYRVTRKI